MSQPGFFVLENRYAGLDAHGDPLVAINASVPFELFRLDLKTALVKGGLRRADAEALRQAVGRHRSAVSAAANIMTCAQETQVSRSEEHTSDLQSLMRISYAVFCLKK